MTHHQYGIRVRGLTMSYGDTVVLQNLDFSVERGDIFIIMGESGCGKSTLMKHLIGLQTPASGHIFYGNTNFWETDPGKRKHLLKQFGVLYQGAALWSSMTLAQNVALPLEEYTRLTPGQIREIVSFKLALVGLKGYEDFYPSKISGGMRKRAGLARAMALDPKFYFFDEPTAGLDPVNARVLDDLILLLNESIGATIVVVTHELPSIFAIGKNAVFLDAKTRTIVAKGNPNDLLNESQDPNVRRFLTRSTD